MLDGKRSINRFSTLLFFLILSTSTIEFSHATETLLPNKSIRDGETLISAKKIFELGFFSPGGSNNRYVGIWYYNLPVKTVVWIANRERPVLDSSGYLTIDGEGKLLILDRIGTSIVISSNYGSTNLIGATLLDSGNLVLRGQNTSSQEQVLWQSFDYPTDTLLPRMILGLDGRENRLLTSWRSSNDPSTGDYSVGIDPNGTRQFIMWRRGEVYWKSGVWNGQNFTLVPEMTPDYFVNFSYVPDWNGSYYSYYLYDSSVISRSVMDLSGQVKQLTWVDSSQEWLQYFAEPKKYPCEVPTYCGANGLCNNFTTPTCNCLNGFKPDSSSNWELGDWSGGCLRRLRLECGNGDGFFIVKGVKLPMFFSNIRDSILGSEDCRAKCMTNCSCTAYASAHENGTGCLLWFGELFGLQENYGGVQDLYVRLVASEINQAADHGSKRLLLWILLAVGVAVAVLFLCALFYLQRRKLQHKVKYQMSRELLLLENDTTVSNKVNEARMNRESESRPDCPFFSFSIVAAATDGFSAANKLGEGGFGSVYKGILEGKEVAVKRLSRTSHQGLVEFKNEIDLISNLQHTNLVRLFGYCIKGEEKILIYEYMPCKSLDSYIFDPTKGAQLDWSRRFHIIEGIAQGLLYLHKYSRFRVIHRDLKASNILLDGEMNPKISDFGIARIFGRNESEANTRRVVGTYGYMAPEYAMAGLFSEKSDVFSFGVLLLEILSGKKNRCSDLHDHSLPLLGCAWELWKEDKCVELIDPLLGEINPSYKFSRYIHVALLCLQDSATDRPTMSQVIAMLSSETLPLPIPKQPVLSNRIALEKADLLASSSTGICSENYITDTTIEAR